MTNETLTRCVQVFMVACYAAVGWLLLSARACA
jgi:hypothetical protein